MKTIVRISILCAALLSACCVNKQPPRAIVVQSVAPKVEIVGRQAKITSDSADRTVELTRIVKEKYTEDQDATLAHHSAVKTSLESKETETQLRVLGEYAKDSDQKVEKLAEENDNQRERISKYEKTIRGLEDKIKELQAKLSSRNSLLASAGLIILILSALILKPWKWFI